MHQPQPTLQLGNGGRRGSEEIRRDFAFGKKLIEGLFLRYQLAAERLSRLAHAIENRLYVVPLVFG